MRKGKMIAQGCHSSLSVFFDENNKCGLCSGSIEQNAIKSYDFHFHRDGAVTLWLNGDYKKIVVSVNSEEELLSIYNQAVKKNIPCSLIEDIGLTEFAGVLTKTAVAIGPWWSDDINEITSDLKLL